MKYLDWQQKKISLLDDIVSMDFDERFYNGESKIEVIPKFMQKYRIGSLPSRSQSESKKNTFVLNLSEINSTSLKPDTDRTDNGRKEQDDQWDSFHMDVSIDEGREKMLPMTSKLFKRVMDKSESKMITLTDSRKSTY